MHDLRKLAIAGSGMMILCVLLVLIVVCGGLGIGYGLNQILPVIDLGLATIIGVLAIGVVAFVASTYMQLMFDLHMATEEDDDEDDEMMSDEEVDLVSDQVAEAIMTKLNGPRGNRANWSQRSRPQRK